MTSASTRLAALRQTPQLLEGMLRGIEKEGLRVDGEGNLARTPHPAVLGSALTNPRITTDYSESLLELITGTHHTVEGLLGELLDTHRYVARNLDAELIWNQSMPAHLPDAADIPIAWYGTSNTGMLKHVYRRGLAERYGKPMQCIAGVHYNFSLPDQAWDLLEATGGTPGRGSAMRGGTIEQLRSRGYMAAIRNFTRYSWLPMYLFGASPAVSTRFLHGASHPLEQMDADTLYLPHATSLRMSDLGYQNKAQSELQLCYNDIETFVARMYKAVTLPWPAYQAIGTHRDGQWIQLNTNVLQIENEYYSSIRPKRATGRCERPVTALAERGVQYIEVRCMDIDPYSPVGISDEASRFLDAFLLFCTFEPSPHFSGTGSCSNSRDNFSRVVKEGRKPGLQLARPDGHPDTGKAVALRDWGAELLDRIAPYAETLDAVYGGERYRQALRAQHPKLADSEQTPSARLLRELRESRATLHEYTLQLSRTHCEALRDGELDPASQRELAELAASSLREQAAIENSDSESFDDYVARYQAALRPPRQS
ncbi:glutamate--cysteine ligase [Candidimonas nitroreducens]|uniref:Glutamate--cysteine ligase n=1 Tax=Candidimonas nitroreducens TaxID=683354 RepID=A0A225MD46_9BURK|nr:glutamate--cysteine ligase [Candidimonas nitroreducens]OWT59088.1 glutamate--cysteine ligase [Candidimonas nitroreducens]